MAWRYSHSNELVVTSPKNDAGWTEKTSSRRNCVVFLVLRIWRHTNGAVRCLAARGYGRWHRGRAAGVRTIVGVWPGYRQHEPEGILSVEIEAMEPFFTNESKRFIEGQCRVIVVLCLENYLTRKINECQTRLPMNEGRNKPRLHHLPSWLQWNCEQGN